MMKQQKIRVAPLLCAALLLGLSAPSALADCPPDYLSRPAVAAVSEQSGQPDYSGPYYPVSVEEYSEAGETRIRKTYQLSLSDDPALIPTGSFTRDGRTYRLLDITQDMYERAKEYYEEHGDLKIPGTYYTADGYALGAWILTQRAVRKGLQRGNLSDSNIQRENILPSEKAQAYKMKFYV